MGCIDWFVLGLLMVGGVLLVALLTVIEFAIGLLIAIWRRLTRFAANICRNRRPADGRSPRRPASDPEVWLLRVILAPGGSPCEADQVSPHVAIPIRRPRNWSQFGMPISPPPGIPRASIELPRTICRVDRILRPCTAASGRGVFQTQHLVGHFFPNPKSVDVRPRRDTLSSQVVQSMNSLLTCRRRPQLARTQKPEPDMVGKAAKALKNPKTGSLRTIRRMAAVVMDDQEYDPQPHRPKPTKG